MTIKKLPDIRRVRSLLDYNPATGIFVWKPRRKKHFPTGHTWQCKIWNARFANMPAGSIQHGYIKINIEGRYLYAHRLAWLLARGRPVPDGIDHIDGDRRNNRISNLRAATQGENSLNAGKRSDNTTGVKGVTVCRQTGRYRAQITKNGKHYQLGRFATLKAAALVRRQAAERLHGAFARHE